MFYPPPRALETESGGRGGMLGGEKMDTAPGTFKFRGLTYSPEQLEKAVRLAILHGWNEKVRTPVTVKTVWRWVMSLLEYRGDKFKPTIKNICQINPAKMLWKELKTKHSCELWLPNTDFVSLAEDLWLGKIHAVQTDGTHETVPEFMEWAAGEYGNKLLGPEIQMMLHEECGHDLNLIKKLPNDLGYILGKNLIYSPGGAFRDLDGNVRVFWSGYWNARLQQGSVQIQSSLSLNSKYLFFVRKP